MTHPMTAPSERAAVVRCHVCGGEADKLRSGMCLDCAIDCHGDPDDEPYEDDGWDDCGLLPDGTCMQAGTEYCDWDCPHNR